MPRRGRKGRLKFKLLKAAHYRLKPLHAFLRGARTHVQIHTRTRVVWVVRAKRVAKKGGAFPTSISQRGLGLVERQPKLSHHPLRPCQRFGRATAAKDDKVVGVGDNMSTEGFATSASTPVLQEPVHVDLASSGLATPP